MSKEIDKQLSKAERISYHNYLNNHKYNVVKAWEWLIKHNVIDISDLPLNQIQRHDASKMGPEEFYAYARYFYGKRTSEVKEAFDYAWLHHIHHNPHHWQYWILVDDGEHKPLDMPNEYIYEMICDWWSFSWRSGDLYEIFGWWNINKDGIFLSSATREKVVKLLDAIKNIMDEEAANKNA